MGSAVHFSQLVHGGIKKKETVLIPVYTNHLVQYWACLKEQKSENNKGFAAYPHNTFSFLLHCTT